MITQQQTPSIRWIRPAIIVAALMVLIRFAMPAVAPWTFFLALMGGMAGALLLVVWWLLFSRARWIDRLGFLVLIVAAVIVTSRFAHPSILGGMMGYMLWVYAVPVMSLALVAGVAMSRGQSAARRWGAMAVAVFVGCAGLAAVRTDGIMGESGSQIRWRWTPTAEEKLLAQAEDVPPVVAAAPDPAPAPVTPAPVVPAGTVAAKPAEERPASPLLPKPEWPGFRGADRDGVVHGVRVETNWTTSPPQKLWTRPIGPGWSSFAVRGDLMYTQEQRGEDEIVACYRVSSGAPVWRHRDPARFWESNGGAGPRGTPTLENDRVYALGATGIINALDARTGAVIWSRNAAADTNTKTPGWGFSGSPLVVGGTVIAAASGKLVGYDAESGKQRWLGPARAGGYSSPHLAVIDGVTQVILLNGSGATSVNPADGKVLWEHAWAGGAITQPALLPDGVLINSIVATGGQGIRRLAVARGAEGWTVEERWTSAGLKPYFNDFVVHKGHAYGFDGSILASVDLADGRRVWKGGRYGSGQVVLLAEQDLLLVLSEEGDLALVSATPDQFKEIARVPAIEGKTWNHPVLVRDVLLVRNGEQMAAFRLKTQTQNSELRSKN